MRKVFSFLKTYHVAIIVALLLMLIELFVELFHPLFMAHIIDEGIMQEDLGVVVRWGALMVGMSFLAFTAGIINSYYAAYVSQNFVYDVRKKLYEKVQSFPFSKLHLFPTSSLITRMTNDMTQLQNTVFMSLRIMLRAPLLVIGGMIMALVVNVQLGLILVCVTPIVLIFLVWVYQRGGSLFITVQEKLDRVNNVMRENLAGMRLIKVFLRSKHEEKRFQQANDRLMERTVSALRLMEITMPVLLFVMNMTIIVILWFGHGQVNTGTIQVGEVVAIVNYATRMTVALSMSSFIIMGFSRAKASAERVAEVLETEGDHLPQEQSTSSVTLEGKVAFEQVSFRYPYTQTGVLKDVSFVAEPGQTVAVMGATGSGKSTLFQLIPRLYDPEQGKILIDDTNIQNMDPYALRSQIGYVAQDSILFSGTVKENIAWGKREASMEEIVYAAQSAQIHNTIMNQLPQQYDTVLGQKGVNLSGGQKQRLSIARALVRQPSILLLDDSTSALDLKTEAELMQALNNYACTTLIITQKMSTAKTADFVLLLDEGMLVAAGSHTSLLQQSALYGNIFRSQFGEEAIHDVQSTP